MRLVLITGILGVYLNERVKVGHSRSRKIKTVPLREMEGDVFYMNLEEARAALQEKYEFLQERHERSKVARNRRLPA